MKVDETLSKIAANKTKQNWWFNGIWKAWSGRYIRERDKLRERTHLDTSQINSKVLKRGKNEKAKR